MDSISLELDDERWGDLFVLGCDRLTAILKDFDLSASLKDLESLSLHFAPTEDCIHWRPTKHHERLESYSLSTTWYASIITLLELCPALNELHLYGYHAWGTARVGLLDQIVERFPNLQLGIVTLQGFGTADGELSRFLRHYSGSLFSLDIGAVVITKEELTDLFHIVQYEISEFDEVRFDNLEVVGRKDPDLLHSSEYFHPREGFHGGPAGINLVFFEDDDHHWDDEKNPHSFGWDGSGSAPISWRKNKPGHRRDSQSSIGSMDDFNEFFWEEEMRRRYGGIQL